MAYEDSGYIANNIFLKTCLFLIKNKIKTN